MDHKITVYAMAVEENELKEEPNTEGEPAEKTKSEQPEGEPAEELEEECEKESSEEVLEDPEILEASIEQAPIVEDEIFNDEEFAQNRMQGNNYGYVNPMSHTRHMHSSEWIENYPRANLDMWPNNKVFILTLFTNKRFILM